MIISVCISEGIGTAKIPQSSGELVADHGLQGDGHAQTQRPVSLLMSERVDAFNAEHGLSARPGDFAENIQTRGLDLTKLQVGARLRINDGVLEVVQLGKPVLPQHYSFFGYRLLPTDGIFCRVLTGGRIAPGDPIKIESSTVAAPLSATETNASPWSRARDRLGTSPQARGLYREFAEPWFDPAQWWFDAAGALRGTFMGQPHHEGYAGIVHGGAITALADAAMTHCLFGHEVSAFTAELKVAFRRPLLIGRPAEHTTIVKDRIGEQIFHLITTMTQEGIVRAEARGTFFRPGPSDPGFEYLAGS
jgi:MOSC domain-containing protein YiiM/acyl-coenzyme A thioesterase PaaI-like protein